MKGPCFKNGEDCPNRSAGCHSECEKYLAFRAELDAINEQKAKERPLKDYSMRSIYRNRRCKTQAVKSALAQR